jgi:hypothetical protein
MLCFHKDVPFRLRLSVCNANLKKSFPLISQPYG